MEWNVKNLDMLLSIIDRLNNRVKQLEGCLKIVNSETLTLDFSLSLAVDQNKMLIALCEEKIAELMKK